MRLSRGFAFAVFCVLATASGWASAAGEFEIGGALAGRKLPLWPTRHGEPAGYPGCLP
jgi:hypothetical protein